ncbi:MAG TPA: tRNA lysidine(34) synthetase TilS [Alphaproteobacteria bacterium]|jgi:tRNA(Ile)-lysidine synthase
MSSTDAARSFAPAMTRLGPFEPRPVLAVAVSGGADSMALALLADAWARERRGRIVALTVDHGLRPEARAEARTVARWMRRRGIAHRVLTWRGAKPETGIQAAAREARYRLLGDWCRGEGVLHLLLGHTRDDQAETVLLRLAAGSGPHGLAAMPIVQETAALRLLRPLLETPRALLPAFLRSRGQEWIEDPSNRDDRFARIRIRRLLAASANEGAHSAALAAAAAELGRFRAGRERTIAKTLAGAARVYPEGYAKLDLPVLAAAAPEIGWRALAALLATLGGLDHPPRGDAVRALHAELCAGRLGRGRTLARCRLVAADGGSCFVIRELRGTEVARVGCGAHRIASWDGRFDLTLALSGSGLEIAALGAEGWAEIVARAPGLRATSMPHAARLALPALRDRKGIVAVPGLGYHRGPGRKGPGRKKAVIATFHPRRVLAPAVFAALVPA